MNVGPRDRALLGGLGVIILLAGLYMLLIRPEQHSSRQLQTQLTAAKATLATAEQQEVAGHAAEVSVRRSRGESVMAQRAVPRVSNIPALLRLLQQTSHNAHVTMEGITFSSAAGSSAASGGATSTSDHGATTIPVALTFDGGYQALDRLVHRLDSFVQITHGKLLTSGPLIGIGSVALSPSGQGNKADPSLNVQLTATIYQHSAASTVLGSSAGSS